MRSVFTKFHKFFQVSRQVLITVYHYGKNALYILFFYNIAQKCKITSKEEGRKIFRVDIELHQHGSQPMNVQSVQMLHYNVA